MGNAIWSILGGLLSAAAPSKGGSLETRTARVGAAEYSYQVHVPNDVGPSPPIIVFLHGIGQRGAGGFLPRSGASNALVRRYLSRVPALILLPQCLPGVYWSNPSMDEMVATALAQTEDEFNVDSTRRYVTGVSMGGYGVWSVAARRPGCFAAIVSICGGSPLPPRASERFTRIANKIGKTPVWIFHGADDPIVPVTESRQMVAALEAVGGNVKYSEYPGVGHSVWTQVLAERSLMPWLLSQRLTQEP
jgi:predicted peptidase